MATKFLRKVGNIISYAVGNICNKNQENLIRDPVYTILLVKFMFSKKATKINEIFTSNLTLCSKCQIDGENFEISSTPFTVSKEGHKN